MAGIIGLLKLLNRHRAALLLLLIGVFIPLQVFGGLVEEVWENEGFPWDVPILLAIHATANPQLNGLAAWLTQLGVFWGVFPVGGLLGVGLWVQRQWRSLTYLLVTFLGSIIINRSVKVFLHRARPTLWTPPAPETDYGFPSGHAMASMTLVMALVILTWDSRWAWLARIFGLLFVLAIGWTRLYLGVHYPSDILAGWMAAVVWAVGVGLVLRPGAREGRREEYSRS